MYLFYMRFLVSRAPRDITIIYSNYKLYFLGFLICGFAIRIYVLLKILEFIPNKQPKSKIMLNLKLGVYVINYYVNHYLNRLRLNFIRQLTIRIKHFSAFSLWLIQKTDKHVKTTLFAKVFFFCETGAKLIVLVVLIMDVFYFKQINYFYDVLGLLFIPLITDFLLKAMIIFSQDNIKIMVGFLDSEPIEGTEYHEFCFYDTSLKPYGVSCLTEYINNYLSPVFDFIYTLTEINIMRIKYKSQHWLLVINIGYFLTWTYVLMVGLGLL